MRYFEVMRARGYGELVDYNVVVSEKADADSGAREAADAIPLVAEDIAKRHLPREGQPAPQRPHVLQQNALARLGRR